MIYGGGFYGDDTILDDDKVLNVLRQALELEIKEKHRYEKMIGLIVDKDIKAKIRRICDEEDKHLKLLRQIYSQVSDEKIEVVDHENVRHESLKKTLKYCIDKELELIKLYTRLQSIIPIPVIKGIFYEMITDEQSHASRLISIYARQDNHNDIEVLSRAPVSYTTKPIKSSNQYIQFDIKIPVVSGIANQNIQRMINNAIESDILEFKRQMEEAAQEGSAEAKSQGQKFTPYIASTNYVVTYNKNNILSISIIYHEYVGGKNVYIRSSYNFDTRTGQALGLRELFKPGVAYRELINAEIMKQIRANPSIYPQSIVANFKGIAADQPYYLDGNNLVVYLAFNESAPTASGIPVVRIPLSKFKNLIRPEYVS